MARKDQKKLFFLACIDEDSFYKFMKESGGFTLRHWAYLRPIRHWREKLSSLIQNSKGIGDIQKQKKIACNKAVSFFQQLPYEDIPIEYYLNFLMGMASDLAQETKNKNEQQILGKIEENLFKLYILFDPEIKRENEMEQAHKDLDKLWEVF